MNFVDVKQARTMAGVRLALSVNAFGPWNQAARKLLEYKKIPFIAVSQVSGEYNDDLYEWTGTHHAPVMIHNDEPPLTRWNDFIILTERLAPTPALLPADSDSRALVFGITHEIAGDWSFGWCRRLMLFQDAAAHQPLKPSIAAYASAYGFGRDPIEQAPQRAADVLHMLGMRLRQQKNSDSAFIVGKALTAADLYWACFSTMLHPLPDDICPMPAEIRKRHTPTNSLLVAAKEQFPILLEHRDYMFQEYLGPVTLAA